MRLALLILSPICLFAEVSQAEQDRLWAEAMRKSAAARQGQPTAMQPAAAQADAVATRDYAADANAAATSYATAAANRLAAIMEQHPRPRIPEISDASTVADSRAALMAKERASEWDKIAAAHASIMRAMRTGTPQTAASVAASAEMTADRQMRILGYAK